ncbi:MAG TPA: PAS domain S-box protein [Burkholderiales bacterium]|nr:PAS domain S-box protein [Burkholderiales bacterium]HUP09026.1 PAS domain S-box protein [Caldimonas sp.]
MDSTSVVITLLVTALAIAYLVWRVRQRTAELEQANTRLRAEAVDRQRVEEDRLRTETRFHAFLEFSPDAMLMVNHEGRIMLANRQVQSLFGYAREELVGLPVEMLMPQARRSVHAELVRQFVASPVPRKMGAGLPLEGLRKDGTVFPADVSLNPVQLADGVQVLVSVHDITERKLAEERIRQGEEELRQLVDLVPEHIFVLEPDGRHAYSNRRALEYTGHTLEDIRAPDFLSTVLHPEDSVRLQPERDRAIAEGTLWEGEARLLGVDGRYRWFLVRLTPLRDVQGRIFRWYGTRTDIEELKRADDSLRRSEAYLAEAQRLSHTGSFSWKPSTGEIVWSAETYRICQCDPATPPTLELVFQRTHPDDLALLRMAIERVLREWKGLDFEHRLLMPDGSVRYVHLVGHAQRDKSGALEFVGAVQDITRHKLAEAERNRLEQRLRQAAKMEAVGRLAGGIAHDFNNVLGGIVAYGEMILEKVPGESPLRRYASNVLIAANQGRALVEQILGYSRTNRGRRAPVDIANVVGEALELVRGTLPPDIRLEASAPGSPLVVIGDATRLHEIVLNLCRNAVQAMSVGGTLRVKLKAIEASGERGLWHGTLAPGSYVRLTVEDNGCGMDESTLSRLFEPFFTTKETGQGTGLGLALVYAIVADLGGAIDVRSAPRQGTTVTIYLPHSEVGLTAEGASAAPVPRGHGERVLLVDDEPLLLEATAEVLVGLGYEPVVFSDSQAALAAFEAAPARFDVVVTDEAMPGLTGTGLAKALHLRRPDLPIVLVSGYSGPLLTQQALAAGAEEVLAKPVESREIAATLARLLKLAA